MAVSVAACSADGTGPGPNQTMGTLAGAVAGGVIGNQIGSGRGQAVATTIGVIAGGLIGSKIGQSLDEADRRRAMEAEYRALEYSKSGSPVVWRNPDRNVYGEVVPGQTYQNAGRNCREYTHTIYIDGQPQVAKGTACRNADGTWAPVS
ncbi:MAG: RT0821/Lpp0805 family surface protein [Tepidamorphaceae bacterium]